MNVREQVEVEDKKNKEFLSLPCNSVSIEEYMERKKIRIEHRPN